MIAAVLLLGSILAMVLIAYVADRYFTRRRKPPVDWRLGGLRARNAKEFDTIAELVSFADKQGIRSQILIDTIKYNKESATLELTMRRQFFYSSGSWLFPTYKWAERKREFTMTIRKVGSCSINTDTMEEFKYGMSPRQATLPCVYMGLDVANRTIRISDDMEHNFHSCLIEAQYDELDVEICAGEIGAKDISLQEPGGNQMQSRNKTQT